MKPFDGPGGFLERTEPLEPAAGSNGTVGTLRHRSGLWERFETLGRHINFDVVLMAVAGKRSGICSLEEVEQLKFLSEKCGG